MKSLKQHFCKVTFVFEYFRKRKLGFFLNFDIWHSWETDLKAVNIKGSIYCILLLVYWCYNA